MLVYIFAVSDSTYSMFSFFNLSGVFVSFLLYWMGKVGWISQAPELTLMYRKQRVSWEKQSVKCCIWPKRKVNLLVCSIGDVLEV